MTTSLSSTFNIPWLDNAIDIELQAPIFRITKLKYLEQMLTSDVSFFSLPEKWTDPYDALFLRSKVLIRNISGTGYETATHSYKNDYFCQCWCMKAGESDAMWRLYSEDKDNVMIVSTVDKVMKSIWDETDEFNTVNYFCGGVKYHHAYELRDKNFFVKNICSPMIPDPSSKNIANAILVKLHAYSHEEEVRFIIRKSKAFLNGNGILYKHQVHLSSIIDKVVIDPRADASCVDKIRLAISKHNFNPIVQKSELYDVPDLVFNID